ncbi:MAG: glycosyltransferase family 25 protein [Devosia sp.]|nr:glycosyltransferase family 25 protein [Devosia sp.]
MLPIYFINTARRTDRREFMERQFAALGLVATRIEAVTPETIDAAVLNRFCNPSRGHRVRPKELANNLSHQAAWRDFLAAGASVGVVFEDDGRLSERLPEFLALVSDGVPDGVDVIKLETMGRRPLRLSHRHPVALGAFTLRRMLSTHFGACGYVITKRLAEAALADPFLNTLVNDAYLFSRHGPILYRRQVYQCLPALSIQLDQDGNGRQSPVARSDVRDDNPVPKPRLRRVTENLRAASRDARYFGREWRGLLGPRHPIPFADD